MSAFTKPMHDNSARYLTNIYDKHTVSYSLSTGDGEMYGRVASFAPYDGIWPSPSTTNNNLEYSYGHNPFFKFKWTYSPQLIKIISILDYTLA